jgi:hypothetical protein
MSLKGESSLHNPINIESMSPACTSPSHRAPDTNSGKDEEQLLVEYKNLDHWQEGLWGH